MSCREMLAKENVVTEVILDTQVIVTHKTYEDGDQVYTIQFSDQEFADFWDEKVGRDTRIVKAMAQVTAPAGRLVLNVATNPISIHFRDDFPEEQLEELSAMALGSILMFAKNNLSS